MSRDLINRICADFPGAEVSDPWAKPGDTLRHDCWKVGGKMFATIGAVTPGVSVKTASIEVADMLIEAGIGTHPKYCHRSWILLPFEADESELRARITESYRIIRSGLPKKIQAALGDLP